MTSNQKIKYKKDEKRIIKETAVQGAKLLNEKNNLISAELKQNHQQGGLVGTHSLAPTSSARFTGMILPNIFKSNVKNNWKVRPFNETISNVGDIQYFPAWSKEWRNSVYHYNSNLIKNFPVYDINLVKIIKLYFNTYFNHQFLNYRHMLNRKRRLSFNKIFFARPEIKHTNSKAIITLYTYNREKMALLKKLPLFQYLTWRLWCLLSSGDVNMKYKILNPGSRHPLKELYLKNVSRVKRNNHPSWSSMMSLKEMILWKNIYRWKMNPFKCWYKLNNKNGRKNDDGRRYKWRYLKLWKKFVWGKRKSLTFYGFSGFKFLKDIEIRKPNRFLNINRLYPNIPNWLKVKVKRYVTILCAPSDLLRKMERFFFKSNMILVIMKDKNILQDFYAFFSALRTSKIKGKRQANKWVKILLKRQFRLLRKYKFKLNLNKYKFEEKFLYKLSNIISKIYNKQIEFNIVNLKKIVFNTDLFTEISTKKIQKRNTRVSKIIHIMLNKANLPRVNRIEETARIVKSVDYNLVENKYRTLNISDILSGNLNLDKLLNKLYTSVVNSKYLPEVKAKLNDLVFNSIKYKNMGGIRMEVKGRLTPRYRADRSVFKLRWKGGLKNIDSSYKGLSVRKNRGHLNPNVGYSMFTSKRRVGAFAVKGWMSGK